MAESHGQILLPRREVVKTCACPLRSFHHHESGDDEPRQYARLLSLPAYPSALTLPFAPTSVMKAAQKMMSKMSPEDMNRMMEVGLAAKPC
jgi:hypothetical protein